MDDVAVNVFIISAMRVLLPNCHGAANVQTACCGFFVCRVVSSPGRCIHSHRHPLPRLYTHYTEPNYCCGCRSRYYCSAVLLLLVFRGGCSGNHNNGTCDCANLLGHASLHRRHSSRCNCSRRIVAHCNHCFSHNTRRKYKPILSLCAQHP